MSDTISIDAPAGETMASLTAPLARLVPVDIGEDSATIGGADEQRIVLAANTYAETEEPEVVALARRMLDGPTTSFTLTTKNMDLVRKVLLRLADVRADLVVDTQHGLVGMIRAIAGGIRADPAWDWRWDEAGPGVVVPPRPR